MYSIILRNAVRNYRPCFARIFINAVSLIPLYLRNMSANIIVVVVFLINYFFNFCIIMYTEALTILLCKQCIKQLIQSSVKTQASLKENN